MKKLSIWGKRNPIPTRIIIVFCHILLISLGIAFGAFAYFEDFQISGSVLVLLTGIFSAAYFFYPWREKQNGIFSYSWAKRVKHDMIMALCYFGALVVSVNQFAFHPISLQQPQPQVRLMSANIRAVPVVFSKKEARKDSKSKIRFNKAEIKKQIKALKAEWKEQTNQQVPLKILLIFLVLVLAAVAFSGLGALSCQLSCSGQEGAAIIVAVGGTAGIIVLSVVAIRAIVRIGKSPKPKLNTLENHSDPT